MTTELTRDDLLTMLATQAEENKNLRVENLELRVRLSKATTPPPGPAGPVEPDEVVHGDA